MRWLHTPASLNRVPSVYANVVLITDITFVLGRLLLKHLVMTVVAEIRKSLNTFSSCRQCGSWTGGHGTPF
jgi:hypothetical protein